jgi:hypothetical protein
VDLPKLRRHLAPRLRRCRSGESQGTCVLRCVMHRFQPTGQADAEPAEFGMSHVAGQDS